MSAPPSGITLSREDFPKQADWIDRLLRPINGFSKEVQDFLGGIPFARVVFKDETFSTGAAVADSFPRSFSVPSKPQSVKVACAEDATADTTFTTPVFATWIPVNDGSTYQVKIRHLTGLAINNKYRITFEVLL